MRWIAIVRDEFARRNKVVDVSVVMEMAQHAADAWEAARADGESPGDAEARVRGLIASWCEATSGPRRSERTPMPAAYPSGRAWFPGLGLDLRLGVRLLRQQPGFAMLSIAMIALAIAATTSLFSIVNKVLLNPLPQIAAEGLFRIFEPNMELQLDGRNPVVTNTVYDAWAESHETITGIGAWNDWSLAFEGPTGLELLQGARITASLFPLIGVRPVLGANFTEAHEITDDAVMLSYGFWQERFGGDASVLGRPLTIGGKRRTIVGVMPRGFEFPDRSTRVWMPQHITNGIKPEGPHSVVTSISAHNALARLKPGMTPEQAASEAAARVSAARPPFMRPRKGSPDETDKRNVALTPMLDWMIKDVKPALWILSAAVTLLFVAAVGNVANMQMGRASTREREVAIRSALGAGSGQLFRQLLIEASLLTAIGAAIGLGIALGILRVLPRLMPEDFPLLGEIAIDARVLGVAAGLTVVVSLLIGLLPLRMARRLELTGVLAEDGASVGHGVRSSTGRSRAMIVTGQVAIAALLLVGAALLSQSLLKLINADRGYVPSNLLTARIAHFAYGLPANTRPAFYREVLDRLTATPGVTHAAYSTGIPLAPLSKGAHGNVDTEPRVPIEGALHIVTQDYFATMGMRVVLGRGFVSEDVPTSEPVVLVNEAFARKYLPREPFDTRLSLELDAARGCAPTKELKSACLNPWRVAGIVGDVRQQGIDASVEPEVFAARSQMRESMPSSQYVIARTSEDPARLAIQLRQIVKDASATGALEQVMTMETRLMTSLARPRLYAALLGGFGGFALAVAVIGLFGGLSHAVTLRTREIGVRSALGATPAHILRMVMKQGGAIAVVGLTIGLGTAAASVRYLSAFLFGIEPFDAFTFAIVSGGVLIVSIVACAIPARRAARIDALDALRR